MKSSPTSEVLINIGWAIATDAELLELAKNTYGRGVQVCVGGYAQKLASDEDAPFVWVYSDEDDTVLNGETNIGFTAKVVLGICPTKDVPTTAAMFAAADALVSSAGDFQMALNSVLATVAETDPLYAAVKADVDAACEACDDVVDEVAEARTAAAAGDFDTMLAKIGAARTSAATMATKFESVKSTLEDVEESAEAIAAAELKATDTATKSAALGTAATAVSQAIARFIDDPFISEVERERNATQSGLTIYGAIRTVDQFKSKLIKILDRGGFGMPLKSVKFKNQAVAHYPLDWSELTVDFENQETLSL